MRLQTWITVAAGGRAPFCAVRTADSLKRSGTHQRGLASRDRLSLNVAGRAPLPGWAAKSESFLRLQTTGLCQPRPIARPPIDALSPMLDADRKLEQRVFSSDAGAVVTQG